MNGVIRNFLKAHTRNMKWPRKLSCNAMKVDEFTITSALPFTETPNGRLVDQFWSYSSAIKDRVALVSTETSKTYTYSQLQKFMGTFATSLLNKLGLRSNDIIAVILPNCPEYPVVAFGAIQAGCIVTPVNPAYKNYELVHQLKVTKPKIVVTLPQAHKTIVTALKDAKVQAKIVVVDEARAPVPDGTIRYSELAENGEADYALLDKVIKTHDDIAIIPFSSGTTGLPKGVQITHKNLLASLQLMRHEKICLASFPDGNHQDSLACVLPFFHIYGLVILLMGHLSLGCKLFTMASFNPDVYLNVLKDKKITLLYGVPPILTFLGKTPTATKEHFEHLKYVFCGAAPLSASDIEELLQKLNPKTQFIQGYAMTETTSMGTVMYKDSGNRHFGSCGEPTMNLEMRFADPNTGNLVPIGEPGEVMVRAPYLMSGYYQNEQATKQCMTSDGFFKTGDLGVYKLNEGLYILDRLKELIKVKGMQVAPAELESILRSHPSVSDAGVVGIPHEFYGEVPKAFVVLNKKQPATADELKAFVEGKVSSYKKIEEIVFIDAIPKNPSGKILRRQLKTLY